MGKRKRFDVGGMVSTNQQQTYPFSVNAQPAGGVSSPGTQGINQTFTMQPQATAQPVTSTGTPFKKGGKVGNASKRADGIAKRGRTKGKIV